MKRLIFGCGYLGSRVANIWHQNGDETYVVTRSTERATSLQTSGWLPIVADITQRETLQNLPTCDTVLVAVGMDRTRYDDIRFVYVDGLKNLLEAIPMGTKHVIYISSTGVYGDFSGNWIDENAPTSPKRPGGKACLEAEKLLLNSPFSDRATILRFAGIYGPDRVPTRSVVEGKRWNELSAEGYLNLIQVQDGAQIVNLISNDPEPGRFVISDGQPVIRKTYYQEIATLYGLPEIPWSDAPPDPNSRSSSSKRINPRKFLERYTYQFQFPDFRSGLRDAFGR